MRAETPPCAARATTSRALSPVWCVLWSRAAAKVLRWVIALYSDRNYAITMLTTAALCFYSDWPYAFDQIAISTGAIFAASASLGAGQELVLGEPL